VDSLKIEILELDASFDRGEAGEHPQYLVKATALRQRYSEVSSVRKKFLRECFSFMHE